MNRSQFHAHGMRFLLSLVCTLAISITATASPTGQSAKVIGRIGQITAAFQQTNPQAALSLTVLPRTQTLMEAWVEYNRSLCTEVSSGNWTVNTPPTKGATATGTINGHLDNGDCPDAVFSFGAIYYTWTSANPEAKTDSFGATWTSPNFSHSDTVGIKLAEVEVNSADLVENKIQVMITGPTKATGSLSLAIKGTKNKFTAKYNNGTAVGPGSYTVTLIRPQMVQDKYSTIEATWNASAPPVTSTFTINPAWNVRGIVQNTVYIKVYEAACKGTPKTGYWTFDPTKCVFTATNFKPMFASQTHLNGSGLTAGGMLIHANVENKCRKRYPAGANSSNTFYTISSVTGSCQNAMEDTNVAAYPNPASGGTYSCGDQLLYAATNTNTNAGSLRDVEDYCPACSKHASGTSDHVDNYYDKNSCTGSSLPNYWEADLGSAGQQIQVPVAGVGETEFTGRQAFYRDGEIAVQPKEVNDGLMLSIETKDRHSDVKLPPEVFGVQKIERYQDRIIVIGDIGASVSRVMVISVDTGVVTDSFDAFYPAVSPDGRFIAFIKFYPPHGATGTEDHLMLYDMTKGVVTNRPTGVRRDNRIDVGQNVYPGNGNKENDNVGVPDRLSHQSPGLTFWSPDSRKLAFIDQTQEVLRLVLVRVAGADAGAAPGALTMIIDGTSVCAAPLPEKPCQAYLDHVKFGDNGLRAFFSGVGTQGSIRRELDVSYADFMPLK
jgi:WD40-like Beta Propeller Repeat